ncbi:MAG: AraC family transcriptional regulator [Clostridia bacterium]
MKNTYINQFENLTVSHKIDEQAIMNDEFKEHFHTFFEILYFISGDLDYVIENKRFKMSPFDIVIMKPTEHHFIDFHSNSQYERYVLKFSERYIPQNLLSIIKNMDSHFSIPDGEIPKLFQKFDDYNENYSDASLQNLNSATLVELFVFLSLLNSKQSLSPTVVNESMIEILEYINNNLSVDLSLDALSQKFYRSKIWLYRAFKESLHTCPNEYITAKRIALARDLLANGYRPTQIFEQCGYQDYSTFYRQYKKLCGTSPKKNDE